ncbi:HipA N-terminal domain-containing protein [Pedosphaera parvula]|uniref:HipA N-terminal domain protein n=1 Tax=Pedosphaera parvula (strain Ellin514) TaxID=320771 RepID=B9XER1_PEDPL|nr:HipA N-terminal domain-containing protein [Pedosphaera parvula]EEF61775.1 HipA N-terminal domain protein [Pedosphaera parvula Ellin514]
MRKAEVFQQNELAGLLEELSPSEYRFSYATNYAGEPISLTLPVRERPYEFQKFPAVFEGLLPEGLLLEAVLRRYKIDRHDLFTQLLVVGENVVGSLTINEVK